jgi:hypothetical protein
MRNSSYKRIFKKFNIAFSKKHELAPAEEEDAADSERHSCE